MRDRSDLALEIGPGKVLAGLVKRIDKTLDVETTGDSSALAAAISRVQGA